MKVVLITMTLLKILSLDFTSSKKNSTTTQRLPSLLIPLDILKGLWLSWHTWESKGTLYRDLTSIFYYKIKQNSYGGHSLPMEKYTEHYPHISDGRFMDFKISFWVRMSTKSFVKAKNLLFVICVPKTNF